LGADYYDRSGDHLKTLIVEKISYLAGAPLATHLAMVNSRSGHRSDLRF
jgi:hypothetical protein